MYDVVIIGAGPGGYQAALEAGKQDLKTALIEEKKLGGTCLNVGCIPTKLFLGATEPIEEIKSLTRIRLGKGHFDLSVSALLKRKKNLISATQKAIAQTLKKFNIDIFQDKGIFENKTTLKLQKQNISLSFKNAIIATGTSERVIPGLEFDGNLILSSSQILELEDIPPTLAIIGSGPIGLELGQYFSRLGSKIMLIEALDRPAPLEDPDISKEIFKHLKKEKWELYFKSKVKKITIKDKRVFIHLENEIIEADKCLVAIGRLPNTKNIGLEKIDIATNKGFIPVDNYLKASKNIFAIGDVNGKAMLAHAAADQGEYVIRLIANKENSPYFPKTIPSCIYGFPEVISVGKKELDLKGQEYNITKVPLISNPIAQAHGLGNGFIKVIWQKKQVVGISAVGFRVSHLITLATIIVNQKWTKAQVREHIFAHPTLDESLKEALLQ
ncbi:dihydrolipoamide dehydrogenase [Desulfonauticus submarinus]|uniref:Dihydrolipoyl dehydrogenase n=1 Tax=Desulfonauticus submarinus TaxID=206665 RepID=A0A1H0FNI9_9BACT|nr:dihydrolipoyl dehydrogenase [Desulfonauticus submarinus]SDN96243.1 dihydrolipoamide dehydrogenase [Desulfonauticus submarinus]